MQQAMTAEGVRTIAASVLREHVSYRDDRDSLESGQLPWLLWLCYTSTHSVSVENGQEATVLRLTLHPEKDVMWIGELRVASASRRRGIGIKLATAAEHLACELGISQIDLLPLAGSEPFWAKIGYRCHPQIQRALTKQVDPAAELHRGSVASRSPGGRS
jgi:hypothetical protein